MKKSQKVLRKNVKEIISVLLSFVLILGTLTIPLPSVVKAAGSVSGKTYEFTSDGFPQYVLFPGDKIKKHGEYLAVGYALEPGMPSEYNTFEEAWGSVASDPIFDEIDWYSVLYYRDDFVMPEHPDSCSGYYVYIREQNNIKTDDNGIEYDSVQFGAYPGYHAVFYDLNNKNISDDTGTEYYACLKPSGEEGYSLSSNFSSRPTLSDDSKLGSFLGWSNNPDFFVYSNAEDADYFIANSTEFDRYDDIRFKPFSSEGILKLYPVYEYCETILSVNIEDFNEGEEPELIFDSNRPEDFMEDYSVVYEKKNGESWVTLSETPTEAGEYRATVTMETGGETKLEDVVVQTYVNEANIETQRIRKQVTSRAYSAATASDTFSIISTKPVITTEPEGKELTYNGNEQELITSGEATDGHMLYSLSKDGEYTTSIPKGKEVGAYTVWYMVKGIEGKDDFPPASIEAYINPKMLGIEWSNTSFTYDGNAHCPSATATGLCGEDTCTLSVTGGQSNAGTYTATVEGKSNDNYMLPENVETSFTISAAGTSVTTAPTALTLVYNGQKQKLINPGEASYGNVVYNFYEEGSFSSDIPVGKDAGTYTVWYMAEGDANHSNSSRNSLTVTIAPKTVVLEWADTEFTYDGNEHCPSAVATGICEGDTCSVTVTGSATEIGSYTAKATALSNSNYALPSTNEQSFKINDIPTAAATKEPAANKLSYDGNYQRLVSQGESDNGIILYSTQKDGEYTTVIPTGKDAGTYTVWYKVRGNTGVKDSEPVSIEITISPKTVSLKWSDTEYLYDGEEHCPNAVVSNLCDGDKCSVTVSGKQKEIGIYTAKATALSNSNYQLPSDFTKEFSILDPDKKKGIVTISMEGFIYGAKPSSPVITSKTNDVSKAVVVFKSANESDLTYRAGVPTEVGNYIVKVTLPKNEDYNACTATARFSIEYLTVPENAYSISGKKGTNGWYVSTIEITPSAGYEISYGDRDHFSSYPIKIDQSVTGGSIYIRDAVSYGQSARIPIGSYSIDTTAPYVVNMNDGEIYFGDENGNVACVVNDENISYVEINGQKVTLTDLDKSSKSFDIVVGAKKETITFSVYDMAGNRTDFSVIVAPSWKRNGVINEGEIYLEAGEKFTIPEGKWKIDGDETIYYGGTVFYVTKEGLYNFKKQ